MKEIERRSQHNLEEVLQMPKLTDNFELFETQMIIYPQKMMILSAFDKSLFFICVPNAFKLRTLFGLLTFLIRALLMSFVHSTLRLVTIWYIYVYLMSSADCFHNWSKCCKYTVKIIDKKTHLTKFCLKWSQHGNIFFCLRFVK